jgi:hypothetical protein
MCASDFSSNTSTSLSTVANLQALLLEFVFDSQQDCGFCVYGSAQTGRGAHSTDGCVPESKGDRP